jgi:hypothetical protein
MHSLPDSSDTDHSSKRVAPSFFDQVMGVLTLGLLGLLGFTFVAAGVGAAVYPNPKFSKVGGEGGLVIRARAARLRDAINTRFGCQARMDDTYQDASCFASISLPVELLRGPRVALPTTYHTTRAPMIVLSNFGRLAVIVHEAQLKPGYLQIVQQLMEAHGYEVVPEAAVAERYNGKLVDQGAAWCAMLNLNSRGSGDTSITCSATTFAALHIGASSMHARYQRTVD